jgi:hypothetical protein
MRSETIGSADAPPTSQRHGTHREPRSGKSWIIAGVLGYLAVSTFPAQFFIFGPGLDPSWVYAVNVLPQTSFALGRDAFFTYGPLGYLIHPLDIGSNLLQASVGWFVLQAIIFVVAWIHLRREGGLPALALFGVLFIAANSIGLYFEYRLLLALGLLLSLAPSRKAPVTYIPWLLGGVLAGMLLYVKFTTGVGAILMMLSVMAVAGVRDRRRSLTASAVLGGAFLASVLIVGGITLGSVATIPRFLRWSLEIAGGFSVGMSFPEPGALAIAGIVSVGAVVGVVLARRRFEAGLAPAALALVLISALAFRHAYIRHHGRMMFGVALAVLALLALTARGRRSLAVVGMAGVLVAGMASLAAISPLCACPWNANGFLPVGGFHGVMDTIQLGETRQRLAGLHEAAFETHRIPPGMLSQLREGDADAIPREIAILGAHEIEWRPNPVLQTYHIFTPALDELVAEHFAEDAAAPDRLLTQLWDLDRRHPMFAAPAMWRSIMGHYQAADLPLADIGGESFALLERRPQAVPIQMGAGGELRASVGDWIDVPDNAGSLVFARIGLDLTTIGALQALAWRVDPVYLEVVLTDGVTERYRMIPPTGEDGILLDPLPRTLPEFLDLLEGDDLNGVVRFRLRGPGLRSYEPDVSVRWFTAEWPESP